MKILLLYLRVISRAEPTLPMHFDYKVAEDRWLRSYKQFRPSIPHDLLVVNCGVKAHPEPWDDVVTHYAYYDELGSDNGTYQAVSTRLGMDYDFILCFNTIAYFWRDGWLEPFVKTIEHYGPGVYSPTASYENNPHLRTPCIGFHPKLMKEYPHIIDTRSKAVQFESGPDNFSLWYERRGYPVRMVTATESYGMKHWRDPPNIFRRGDQSNCLVWDRHTDLYQNADAETKFALERAANNHH